MKDELVAGFQGAIQDAIENGTTIADFRKSFDSLVKKHGWQYNGERGWRTKVIFDTNVNQAYQAGHWKQIQQDKEIRPYLVYKTQGDVKVRDLHRAWDGIVLPVDDPWWDTHYPLNGYNCRCYVRQITAGEAEAEGYVIREKAPPVIMQKQKVRAGGKVVEVETPAGISPGFAGNSGKAWGGDINWSGMDKATIRANRGNMKRIKGIRVIDGEDRIKLDPRPTIATRGTIANNIQEAENLFKSAIGGKEAILTDPMGEVVHLSDRIFKHLGKNKNSLSRASFFPYIKELIEDPDEIRISFWQVEKTREVILRKTYIRAVASDDKQKNIKLVADDDILEITKDNGYFSGFTIFPATEISFKNDNHGHVIYKKK